MKIDMFVSVFITLVLFFKITAALNLGQTEGCIFWVRCYPIDLKLYMIVVCILDEITCDF